MRAILFAGPSLAPHPPQLPEGVELRPPVAQGDVLRAARERPFAIGLIDGVFEGEPAVWHKEILFALESGIHVLGAASMGALRAAECAAFGMVGVGEIFAAYASGTIEADDAVAVLHGPAELGWVQLTEALVDVEATLAAARGSFDGAIVDVLGAAARRLHYKDRSWSAIMDGAALRPADRERFGAWLERGRVSLKRRDALALIEALAALMAEGTPLPTVPWRLERTQIWEDLVRSAGSDTSVLDEARLVPGLAADLARKALLRHLAGDEAATSRSASRRDLERFRLERGLATGAQLRAWLEERGVDEAWLRRQVEAQRRVRALVRDLGAELEPLMLEELRLTPHYPELAQRAARKAALPDADEGPSLKSLVRWFAPRVGLDPAFVEADELAASLAFLCVDSLHEALIREYRLQQTEGETA
ncbi:MAG: TfuA-like protein [Geminicoccaceae bacterium]